LLGRRDAHAIVKRARVALTDSQFLLTVDLEHLVHGVDKHQSDEDEGDLETILDLSCVDNTAVSVRNEPEKSWRFWPQQDEEGKRGGPGR
jgi:hypothetical protein